MSEAIKLSQELINDLLKAIAQHDGEGSENMIVNIQYLVGVAGYLCADYPGQTSERDQMLKNLGGFMKHVCDDRAAGLKSTDPQQQTAEPAAAPEAAPDPPKGKSEGTGDPAVGVWKPE